MRRVVCRCWGVVFSLFFIALAVCTPAAGQVVLVATQNDWGGLLKEVDAMTGATPGTSMAALGIQLNSLSYDPLHDVLYGSTVSTGDLYAVDYDSPTPTDPASVMTLIGATGLSELAALAYDPFSGALYGAHGAAEEDGFYQIDTATGVPTLIGHTGFFNVDHSHTVSGMAVDPFSGKLYGSISGEAYPYWGALIEINPSTGAGTLVSEWNIDAHVDALAFHPTTGVLYGVDGRNATMYTIDVGTAELTRVSQISLGRPYGLEFIPEPMTVLLLGLGSLVLLRRR